MSLTANEMERLTNMETAMSIDCLDDECRMANTANVTH